MITQGTPQVDRYNVRNRRIDSERTFQRRNQPNQYRNVNCAVGHEVDGRGDNQDYDKEESDNSDYHGGHSHGQVLLTENGDNGA